MSNTSYDTHCKHVSYILCGYVGNAAKWIVSVKKESKAKRRSDE